MKLRELLEDSDLGLRLLTGPEAPDRTLTSVFTTDLRDPSRYLSADTLVLTGLMWWRGPADSEVFVRAAAEHGVAAVAAGEAAWGSVPDDLVSACREFGVPLLAVPVDVSFANITDLVAGRHEAERGRHLALALGRQRQLLSAVAEGRRLDDLLSLVASQTALSLHVLTPAGRIVASSTSAPGLSDADLDTLSRSYLMAERLPASVELGDRTARSLVAVESGPGRGLTSWFLVCDGRHHEWPEDVRTTVDELAAVSAVERQRAYESWRRDQPAADEIVAAVASGQPPHPELDGRLTCLDAKRGARSMVVVADLLDASPESAADALRDVVLQVTPCSITSTYNDRAIAILAEADSESLRVALERLGPGLERAAGAVRLVAGISGPVSVDALAGAFDEAAFAARIAASRSGRVCVVSSDELTSYVALLAAVPDDVRRSFATRVLRPVVDYDERHRGDLLPTLEAFLRVDCSWQRCADALQVHVNTVRYRIGRVAELTGRDMSHLQDRIDLQLALHSLPRSTS